MGHEDDGLLMARAAARRKMDRATCEAQEWPHNAITTYADHFVCDICEARIHESDERWYMDTPFGRRVRPVRNAPQPAGDA
jgi:hypothetical protein